MTEGLSVRDQLLDRRRRLDLLASGPGTIEIRSLLREIDAALGRIDRDEFGLCETCHDPIEEERLFADPTVRVCLDCLSTKQARALERDLELAHEIQSALLPAANLSVSGWELHYRYRPHGPVSGDYCDVWRSDGADGTLHFLLGDVSGKGVAASILMSALHAVFRSLVPLDLPLDEVLVRANRLFSQSTLPSSFATLIAGRLEPSGQVEIGNAGHCPALLVRNDELVTVDAGGVPLGVVGDAAYTVERFGLGADDRLLLYTDGLSEARNRRGTLFEQQRIAEVVAGSGGESAEQLVSRCVVALERFLEGAPVDDDLTIMGIRRGN